MGTTMSDDAPDTDALLERLRDGDQEALAALFARHQDRLRRMVRLRLDRRLQGRLDPSDVLQEAFIDVAGRAAEYVANPVMPFYLWVRFLTGQRLLMLHRRHLGARMRNAGQEVAIHR